MNAIKKYWMPAESEMTLEGRLVLLVPCNRNSPMDRDQLEGRMVDKLERLIKEAEANGEPVDIILGIVPELEEAASFHSNPRDRAKMLIHTDYLQMAMSRPEFKGHPKIPLDAARQLKEQTLRSLVEDLTTEIE